jgi:hypothetical protein
MPRPDFLVIGAAKCGTTTLCSLLGRHPEVFVHPEKELNFFCFDELYARGFAWYARKFDRAEGRRAVGEGSPNYAKRHKHPLAAERIAKHLPDARLLYIVRHPLRRMESAWLHARRSGHRSSASFSRTLRSQPTYLDASLYERQIDAYRAHFPDARILVLFLDDLRARPQETLARAFAFLGVDPAVRVPDAESALNVSAGKRVDRLLLRGLRRLPGFERFDRRAPRAWRRFRTRFLRREMAGRPVWDDATRRWAVEQLAEPTARFLVRYGKPADYWDLER